MDRDANGFFLSLPIFGSSIEGIVDNLSTSVACEYI